MIKKLVADALLERGAWESIYSFKTDTSLWSLLSAVVHEMTAIAKRENLFYRSPKFYIDGGARMSLAKDLRHRKTQRELFDRVLHGYDCHYCQKANVWVVEKRQEVRA